MIRSEFTHVVSDCVLRFASCLQCALIPVPRLRLGLPMKLWDIDKCRFALPAYRLASAVKCALSCAWSPGSARATS